MSLISCFETRSLPALTHVVTPIWNLFTSQLTRRYPSRLCLLCRFPQTLNSLTRDVFYLAHPISLSCFPDFNSFSEFGV
jgi:hypothetical protein